MTPSGTHLAVFITLLFKTCIYCIYLSVYISIYLSIYIYIYFCPSSIHPSLLHKSPRSCPSLHTCPSSANRVTPASNQACVFKSTVKAGLLFLHNLSMLNKQRSETMLVLPESSHHCTLREQDKDKTQPSSENVQASLTALSSANTCRKVCLY